MFQKNLLQGKNILVTGGGTGLGRSMALGFADLGANIALCGRRRDVLEETAKEIKKRGVNVFFRHLRYQKPGRSSECR